MQLCLTILMLSPHKTRHGALQNSLKQLFRIGIIMFCIAVIIDVSAELAQSSGDYSHLKSRRESSKRS